MVATRKILQITAENILEEIEEDLSAKAGKKEEKISSGKKFLEVFSLASNLGLSISLPIAGGALLGSFLDNKFNTSPRMTLSLIFLGIFIGAANIYVFMKETRED